MDATNMNTPVVRWEETDCLLCGGNQSRVLLEAKDVLLNGSGPTFRVIECLGCGLAFTNPRPTAEAIGAFYPTSYMPYNKPHRERPAKKRWYSPRSWKDASPLHLTPPHGQGRLLDFGCGAGVHLFQMQRRGWKVMGMDMSQQAVDRIRNELGIEAIVGTLPHPDLKPESFDQISMMHSLEHVHNPLAVLRSARTLLAPGGKLLIVVPNLSSLARRWCGTAWQALELPRHLIHFTPDTLSAMVRAAGFLPGKVHMERHASLMQESAERAVAQSSQASIGAKILLRKHSAKALSWYCWATGQSDVMLMFAERG